MQKQKTDYPEMQKCFFLLQVTSKFELYTCFSPLVTKTCAINAITKLLRWIKKEEDRLFIRYPPKYSTTPNPSKSSKGGKHGTELDFFQIFFLDVRLNQIFVFQMATDML